MSYAIYRVNLKSRNGENVILLYFTLVEPFLCTKNVEDDAPSFQMQILSRFTHSCWINFDTVLGIRFSYVPCLILYEDPIYRLQNFTSSYSSLKTSGGMKLDMLLALSVDSLQQMAVHHFIYEYWN